MLVNISEIKRRVEEVLHARFDHKFLNEDHPPSAICRRRRRTSRASFSWRRRRFSVTSMRSWWRVTCRKRRSEARPFFRMARAKKITGWSFSAARQTMSPHLSAEENEQLFGVAASPFGHGHHYRARFTFREPTQPA